MKPGKAAQIQDGSCVLNLSIFEVDSTCSRKQKPALLGLTHPGRGAKNRSLLSHHHDPVFGIDNQGSHGAKGSPLCNSSMEMLSGERTNAM